MLLGDALTTNPAFLELRRIDAAREISTIMSRSRNRVYLEADTLLMNLTQGFNENMERTKAGESSVAAAKVSK